MNTSIPCQSSIGPSPPTNRLPQNVKADELTKAAGWDTIPLFMTELPQALNGEHLDSSRAINPSIEALQALIYDDDDDEKTKSMQALKERANELFGSRDYRQSLGFYNQAIEILQSSASGHCDTNREMKHLTSILNVPQELGNSLYSNRAACHLALGNFRSCLTDCATILKPPLPMPATRPIRKCFFRSAKALIGLERFNEALDLINKLIAIDQRDALMSDPEPEKLKLEIELQIKQRLKKKEEARLALEKQQTLQKALKNALRSRGISIPIHCPWPPPESILPPGFEPAHFEDIPREIDATELSKLVDQLSIVYPVYVFRPQDEYPTRDLILRWHEDDLMSDHLEALCGRIDRHRFYLITAKHKILKCGNNLTIRKISKTISKDNSGDSLCLADMGHIEFFLLPIGHLENEWIDKTKKSFLK